MRCNWDKDARKRVYRITGRSNDGIRIFVLIADNRDSQDFSDHKTTNSKLYEAIVFTCKYDNKQLPSAKLSNDERHVDLSTCSIWLHYVSQVTIEEATTLSTTYAEVIIISHSVPILRTQNTIYYLVTMMQLWRASFYCGKHACSSSNSYTVWKLLELNV